MVDCRYVGQDMSIDRVRVMGLENSWHLPMRKRVRGMLTGNENWRSPEAHMKGELNKPSDMFSFGAVVSDIPCKYHVPADWVSASTLC